MEDEVQFLLKCSKLEYARKQFIDECKQEIAGFNSLADTEKLKLWVGPEHVRKFAKLLEYMTDVMRDLVYK